VTLDAMEVLVTGQGRKLLCGLVQLALDGCARSFKVRMAASLPVRMCGREEGPAGVSRRGLGVRGGVVVVSLP
jgi:hypothetical protein